MGIIDGHMRVSLGFVLQQPEKRHPLPAGAQQLRGWEADPQVSTLLWVGAQARNKAGSKEGRAEQQRER